jgi:Fic family protein
MGRLWQTLILRSWKPILGYLPVESVIKQRQQDYYRVLSETDKEGDSSRFIEFILTALRDAINEAAETTK